MNLITLEKLLRWGNMPKMPSYCPGHQKLATEKINGLQRGQHTSPLF